MQAFGMAVEVRRGAGQQEAGAGAGGYRVAVGRHRPAREAGVVSSHSGAGYFAVSGIVAAALVPARSVSRLNKNRVTRIRPIGSSEK